MNTIVTITLCLACSILVLFLLFLAFYGAVLRTRKSRKRNIINYVLEESLQWISDCDIIKHYSIDEINRPIKIFDLYYNDIKTKVMYDNVQELDRHKLAAIIICSIVKANAIQYIHPYKEKEYIFDGNEKIALNIGLSYMNASLKKLLSRRPHEAEKFTDFIFPQASMCDTEYVSILCRNLCYAKRDYKLNPIDLANTLFLLEYITLIQVDIHPDTMKQLCDEIADEKRR